MLGGKVFFFLLLVAVAFALPLSEVDEPTVFKDDLSPDVNVKDGDLAGDSNTGDEQIEAFNSGDGDSEKTKIPSSDTITSELPSTEESPTTTMQLATTEMDHPDNESDSVTTELAEHCFEDFNFSVRYRV